MSGAFRGMGMHRVRWASGAEPEMQCAGCYEFLHVHDGYGLMGRRAPSDRTHMVALCHAANVGVPSKEARAFFRGYLATVNL